MPLSYIFVHDELKKRNYAPWAIAAGAAILIVSVMGWGRKNAGNSTPAGPGGQSTAPNSKIELTVSEQMVQVMIDAALKENPALRDNMQEVKKSFEDSAKSQEMMVSEAIEDGIAAKDPIVRNRLSELFLMSVYQEADMGVTDEAVRKYYEDNKDKYTMPERRLVQHLFVRVTNVTDNDKAKSMLAKIFAESQGPAEKMSEAVAAAVAPAWITREEIRLKFGPSMADLIFTMPVGVWSEPIMSTSGWHRIKVIEHQDPRVRPFEEVEAEVENDLRMKLRMDAYNRELERLSEKYSVRIVP